VIRRYVEISRHGISSGSVKSSLDRAEELMDTLLKAYEVQLAKLLSNDVMDLDTEIEVLKKSMRYSGLEDME
jgi:5-bromo-4-chloroindolyl phosphate hydrolysis protein